MADCIVSGEILDANNELAEGIRVYAISVIRADLITDRDQKLIATSDEDGLISFTLPQGATATLQGNFYVNGQTFAANFTVTIPSAATADLIDLVAAATFPTQGAVVKSNGTALASLFGTFDFSSAFTITESPTSELNIDLASSTESVQDTVGTMAPAALLTYNDTPGTLTLTPLAANRIWAGPATGADAVPTARLLVAADVPDISATYALASALTSEASARAAADLLLAPLTPTVNAQTGTTYTLQASDNGKIITLSNAAGITLTVPAGLGAGFNCLFVQIGAGTVTLAASGTTINNRQGFLTLAGQYAVGSLVAYAANVIAFGGDAA